jgi:hypothetical protein
MYVCPVSECLSYETSRSRKERYRYKWYTYTLSTINFVPKNIRGSKTVGDAN